MSPLARLTILLSRAERPAAVESSPLARLRPFMKLRLIVGEFASCLLQGLVIAKV
jgi:hypothetical protein